MSTYDPTDIAKHSRTATMSEEQKRRAQLAEEADFRKLMAEPWGRRIVWRTLQRCGVFHSSMTGNSETFYREGRRSIGLEFLLNCNSLCPSEYKLMVEENTHG